MRRASIKGLLCGKTYTVLNPDDGTSMDIANSIEITLPQKRSSVIFEYKLGDK